jgi:hypothetical protein
VHYGKFYIHTKHRTGHRRFENLAVITTTLPAFKKLINGAMPLFEGQERVVTIVSGTLIQAFKVKPDRIFADAWPLKAIGYPSIAMADVKLVVEDAQALIDHILSLLNSEELNLLRETLKE